MKTMKALSVVFAFVVAPVFLSGGCGSEIDSKNMDQLHAEKGVPVKTRILETTVFSKSLKFNSVITGVKESSAFTTLSDKVESINFKVGDYVKKDAVVLTFPTDNPSAQYFQAKLAFENATSNYERMKRFYETGGLSRQDFENAETSYKVAEADWNSIKQAIKVKAPISGILTRINARETDNVHKDDELFTIAQVDRLKTRVWVSDRDITRIQNGQKATANWNGNTITGKVVQVDLSMNQERKAFAVDIEFDNPENKVRTGVTADVVIEIYHNDNALAVEQKNILKEDTNRYVFLNDNGEAKKQKVVCGLSSETEVEITGGLYPGDEVIVEGQMLLEDKKKINVVNN